MATGIIISSKGGTGKTTFAINLAKAVAATMEKRRGKRKKGVLYLDFDILDPNGSLRLQESMANNFYRLLKSYDDGTYDYHIRNLCYYMEKYGISIVGSEVIPAAQREEAAMLYENRAYRKRLFMDLDRIISEYDHCIIDTPGGGLNNFIPLILGSDTVYTVFDLRDEPSIRSSERCIIDFFYYCHKHREIRRTAEKMVQVLFSFYEEGQLRRYRGEITSRLREWLNMNLDESYGMPIDPWVYDDYRHWLSRRRDGGKGAGPSDFRDHLLSNRLRFLDGLPKSPSIEKANTMGRIYFGNRFGNLFKEGTKKIQTIANLFLEEAEHFDTLREKGEVPTITDYALHI